MVYVVSPHLHCSRSFRFVSCLHFLIGNLFINFVQVHLVHFSDMGTNVKDLFLNCSYQDFKSPTFLKARY
jgi:hypothetical protein